MRSRLAATISLVGRGPGDSLDVGMGPGRLCEALGQRLWTVSGVDVSPEMVARARQRLPEAADRLRVGSIQALPFADASFDVVTATGVFEYADDVAGALRELARVLRIGGRAVLSVPNGRSLHGLSRRTTDPLLRAVRGSQATQQARRDRIPPIEGFASLSTAAALRIDGTRYVGALIIPAPLDRLFPRASQALGETFERRPRSVRRVATQIVVRATRVGAEP